MSLSDESAATVHRFVLETLDPSIGCTGEAVVFTVADADVPELCAAVGVEPPEITSRFHWDLPPDVVAWLKKRFALTLNAASVVLRPWHPVDDLPYLVHTN